MPTATKSDSFELIPVAEICPSPTNPRKRFDQASLDELAASIKANGVIQPIVVTREDDFPYGYTLVAGERRYRAAKIAALETIPAMVRDLTPGQVLEIQVIENNQREDVHPLEEAEGFRLILESKIYGEGLPAIERLAGKVGKSTRYVYDSLKLIKDLSDPVREAFLAGKLTKTHAVLLSRLTPEQQEEAMVEIFYEDEESPISSRDLAAWISENITLELSAAPWSFTDAELLPQAGACSQCPKNTAIDKLLFPEFEGAAEGLCTDRECYQAKQSAHLSQLRAHLAKESGSPVILLTGRYAPEGSEVRPAWDVQIVEKGTEGAVPAVFADTTFRGKLGEVVYVKAPAAKVTDAEDVARRQREQEARDRVLTIEKEHRLALLVDLADHAHFSNVSFTRNFVLRLLECQLCYDSHLEKLKKHLPWTKPKEYKSTKDFLAAQVACETDLRVLAQVATLIIFAGNLEPWQAQPDQRLEEAARSTGLDVATFRMEIAAKHMPGAPEPEKEQASLDIAAPASSEEAPNAEPETQNPQQGAELQTPANEGAAAAVEALDQDLPKVSDLTGAPAAEELTVESPNGNLPAGKCPVCAGTIALTDNNRIAVHITGKGKCSGSLQKPEGAAPRKRGKKGQEFTVTAQTSITATEESLVPEEPHNSQPETHNKVEIGQRWRRKVDKFEMTVLTNPDEHGKVMVRTAINREVSIAASQLVGFSDLVGTEIAHPETAKSEPDPATSGTATESTAKTVPPDQQLETQNPQPGSEGAGTPQSATGGLFDGPQGIAILKEDDTIVYAATTEESPSLLEDIAEIFSLNSLQGPKPRVNGLVALEGKTFVVIGTEGDPVTRVKLLPVMLRKDWPAKLPLRAAVDAGAVSVAGLVFMFRNEEWACGALKDHRWLSSEEVE